MIVIVENLKKFLFVFSFVNFFIRDKIVVATYAFAFIMVPFLNFNYFLSSFFFPADKLQRHQWFSLMKLAIIGRI
jgi:prepilin signal peptidase PulO-like enzyme (type II secretory pathway)